MKELLQENRPLIVASLSGRERLSDASRRATNLGADLIEVRIDSLKPKERANIKNILSAVKENTSCPIIATVRSSAEQGPNKEVFPIAEPERKNLIEEAMSLADWVDLELEGGETTLAAIRLARKLKKKVILSYHDFKGIPSQEKVKKLASDFVQRQGNVLKIVGMASSAADVVRLLEMCRDLPQFKRSFIAMGDIGRLSRVGGFLFGSCLTYGYMNKPTAPGQVSVTELVELCRLFYPSSRSATKK